MLYTGPKKFTATIKCLVRVEFYDNGVDDFNDQAADVFNDGDFQTDCILDISDIEETQNDK